MTLSQIAHFFRYQDLNLNLKGLLIVFNKILEVDVSLDKGIIFKSNYLVQNIRGLRKYVLT